jgi:hypothetical protein
MAVESSNLIDAIGTDVHTDEVVLSLVDANEWGDRAHLSALQDKLNSYFTFIETGQLLEEYPKAQGRAIRIDVVCRFEPDNSALDFLANARAVASNANWALTWRVA